MTFPPSGGPPYLRSPASGRVVCVLVVDDQPDVRLALAYTLDSLGCQVADAPDVRQALKYLSSHRVDVVLAELVMPDEDGVELIAAIQLRPPPRPRIIAMTNLDQRGTGQSLQAAQMAGADAIVFKPITKDRLLGLILEVIAKKPDASARSSRHSKEA